MHVYFSGIGGTAIGPLALIAHQAGHKVSGSDKQSSNYIEYLKKNGISSINIGQNVENISDVHTKSPINWIVYSSAVAIENPDHPELKFAEQNDIKATKRAELLNKILDDSGQKLIAIAGTHGKTTTTAMAIWLFNELGSPLSYSVGAKISFGDMGHFDQTSEYFVYECDEFDRNFLAFKPHVSLISGVDWDHHEIYPTKDEYLQAFTQFLNQSQKKYIWGNDAEKFEIIDNDQSFVILGDDDPMINEINIVGEVNRKDALLVIATVHEITGQPIDKLIAIMERFPGLSRRFERIADNLYTDYAHTIPKIKGCLQMAQELSDNIVVVYEPLTDRRQHFIKDEYSALFDSVTKLYWVPSYLAREDPDQTVLKPDDLIKKMNNPEIAESAKLDQGLKNKIDGHLKSGDLVVCLSGGGGGSLDEWLNHQSWN